ncbi:MAG: hypothetical protein QXJ27_08025 [Thermoplasmata archaeon]
MTLEIVNFYFFLVLLALFFAFFISPFFSALVGGGEERPGITRVFVKVVKERKEALLLWGCLAFGDAVLATLFLYLLPALWLPLALLCTGIIIFIYVVELHGINKMFWKGVGKNGN